MNLQLVIGMALLGLMTLISLYLMSRGLKGLLTRRLHLDWRVSIKLEGLSAQSLGAIFIVLGTISLTATVLGAVQFLVSNGDVGSLALEIKLWGFAVYSAGILGYWAYWQNRK